MSEVEELRNPMGVCGYLRERRRQLGSNALTSLGAGVMLVPASIHIHPFLSVLTAGASLLGTVSNAQAWDEITTLGDHLEAEIIHSFTSELQAWGNG